MISLEIQLRCKGLLQIWKALWENTYLILYQRQKILFAVQCCKYIIMSFKEQLSAQIYTNFLYKLLYMYVSYNNYM